MVRGQELIFVTLKVSNLPFVWNPELGIMAFVYATNLNVIG